MSLPDQILKLPPAKLLELQDSLVEIGLVLEMGGDYKALIRKKLLRHPVGILRKVHKALLKVEPKELDKILAEIVIST
jgi:hypothetical protein